MFLSSSSSSSSSSIQQWCTQGSVSSSKGRPVSVDRGFTAHGCTGCGNAEDANEKGGAGHPRSVLQTSPMEGGVLPAGAGHLEGNLPTTLQPFNQV